LLFYWGEEERKRGKVYSPYDGPSNPRKRKRTKYTDDMVGIPWHKRHSQFGGGGKKRRWSTVRRKKRPWQIDAEAMPLWENTPAKREKKKEVPSRQDDDLSALNGGGSAIAGGKKNRAGQMEDDGPFTRNGLPI